jgi:hypothetical protein
MLFVGIYVFQVNNVDCRYMCNMFLLLDTAGVLNFYL